jgi:hypothetical protein
MRCDRGLFAKMVRLDPPALKFSMQLADPIWPSERGQWFNIPMRRKSG